MFPPAPRGNMSMISKGIHKEKVQKKTRKKKLTTVSFAFTHTYTPVKTNIFPFFPKRTWKILKNVQKLKIYCPMLPAVVSFPPS